MQYVNCRRSDITKVAVASEVKKNLCIGIVESEKNKEVWPVR